ncbi:hypothetical protein BB560_006625 [Smittium megazygosporum]|uniref:Chromatin associated protein KTI12 n=1 Tax=Smittium megazygosporum TaxID=133381 RepID=A0A2T9Y307_9FUNG|nr:hypothetical protein BB560_006625 [Smittium megazygosporum]
MPLILFTGYPSSGKTTRAIELKDWLTKKIDSPGYSGPPLQVLLVSDSSQGISKTSYEASVEEKKARSSIMSAVERQTSKNSIVIVDSLNYIKGFRYQLYCVARSLGTPHCVIYTAAPIEFARNINSKRPDGYPSEIFENLVSRYEEPNSSSRWDSPLFTILQHSPDETIPFDQIWETIVEKKAPPPNLATAIDPVTESNFLYIMEKSTKEIIQKIMDSQNLGISTVDIPDGNCKICLLFFSRFFLLYVNLPGRPVTLIELRRLRKQFISINRIHKLNINSISRLFAEYLNSNF